MSFLATLTVEGKNFNVLQCIHSMSQKAEKGKPTSGVRGGIIILILDGTDDDVLGNWATGATVKKDGEIVFERIDQQSTLQKLEFQEAYATLYFEFMSSKYINSEAVFESMASTQTMDLTSENDFLYRVISNTKTLLRFAERTRISNCILMRLSAAKIKLDGIEHKNT